MPDQRHDAAGFELEVDLVQHRSRRLVAERHVLEHDPARPRRQLARVRRVGDLLGLVEHLEDALARGGRALRLADPHAELPQGQHEQREEQVERDEIAERECPVRDHVPADVEDRCLREQRQEAEQRDVERALSVRLDAECEHLFRAPLELRLLARLLCEGLDDMDADDVLLGDRRDVGHLLLHVTQQGMRHVAVAVRDGDQHRCDRERDQRELPRDDEDHDADADDREDVLEEEDQAVAEEEADTLQIDGRAAHQLARLVPVVEAVGKTDELRVERRRACPSRRAAPACPRSAGDRTSSARARRRARPRAR